MNLFILFLLFNKCPPFKKLNLKKRLANLFQKIRRKPTTPTNILHEDSAGLSSETTEEPKETFRDILYKISEGSDLTVFFPKGLTFAGKMLQKYEKFIVLLAGHNTIFINPDKVVAFKTNSFPFD